MLLLYQGHAPVQLPAGSAGSSAVSQTLTNHPTPGVGAPLPAGAQYLVYEPDYTGVFTVSSTCDPPAVANTSFETEITLQNPGYSFKPSASGRSRQSTIPSVILRRSPSPTNSC